MIYYFIHLINKILHLLYRNSAPSINHWSDGTDKLTDLFCIHTGLLGYSAERVFVICYFLYIYLNFSSQFFCKVDILFMHQVGMIFLLKIKSSYQFGKFQRFVFRLVDDRNYPLPPSGGEYHEEDNGEHRQIQSPSQRSLRKEIPERGHLYLGRLLHVTFGADNG